MPIVNPNFATAVTALNTAMISKSEPDIAHQTARGLYYLAVALRDTLIQMQAELDQLKAKQGRP